MRVVRIFRVASYAYVRKVSFTEVATMPWTRDDETADTLPAPADDHDAAERWVEDFITRMRDADHVIAVLLTEDLHTAGDL